MEQECVFRRLDTSDVRCGEMSGDQQMVVLGGRFEKSTASGAGERAVFAVGAVQVRLSHLNRVVDDVAEKDAGVLRAPGPYGDVTWSVTGRGDDGEEVEYFVLA